MSGLKPQKFEIYSFECLSGHSEKHRYKASYLRNIKLIICTNKILKFINLKDSESKSHNPHFNLRDIQYSNGRFDKSRRTSNSQKKGEGNDDNTQNDKNEKSQSKSHSESLGLDPTQIERIRFFSFDNFEFKITFKKGKHARSFDEFIDIKFHEHWMEDEKESERNEKIKEMEEQKKRQKMKKMALEEQHQKEIAMHHKQLRERNSNTSYRSANRSGPSGNINVDSSQSMCSQNLSNQGCHNIYQISNHTHSLGTAGSLVHSNIGSNYGTMHSVPSVIVHQSQPSQAGKFSTARYKT